MVNRSDDYLARCGWTYMATDADGDCTSLCAGLDAAEWALERMEAGDTVRRIVAKSRDEQAFEDEELVVSQNGCMERH